MSKKGFTLIELLIVIAIIAILAGVVFVSLDPLSRFRDARDAARYTDVTAILSAIKVDQVDNKGPYAYGLRFFGSGPTAVAADTNYQISNATTTSGCDTGCAAFISGGTPGAKCLNLQSLVDEGYLGKMPVNPNGSGSWSSALSGYYASRNTNGSVTIGSCDAESATPISVTR
ncbi:MAG: prepilin-type N-terminal cleavage/methylation domain-containing protein [Patescibacteria group bacterium]